MLSKVRKSDVYIMNCEIRKKLGLDYEELFGKAVLSLVEESFGYDTSNLIFVDFESIVNKDENTVTYVISCNEIIDGVKFRRIIVVEDEYDGM